MAELQAPEYGDGPVHDSPGLLASGTSASNQRKVVAPGPNPAFSFPMLPPAPESTELESGRVRIPSPLNLPIQPQSSMSSLVGAAHLDPPQGSPSKSGFGPPRAGGHRRGGSEFIGGDSSKTGPGLMSTSPTKGEGVLPSPPASIGRRRGHAHRRSGAISHHDLSAILKPRDPASLPEKHGSLPSTPTVPHPPSLDHSVSQPALRSTPAAQALMDAVSNLPDDQTPSSNPQTRPRVGFSDTLEFIPRPLSTISSETSSSLSTIRPSHSVSGSISSIISIGTSSPPSAKKNQYTHDVLQRYRQASSPRQVTAESPERVPSLEDSPLSKRRPSSPNAGAALKASSIQQLTEDEDAPAELKWKFPPPSALNSPSDEVPSPWTSPPSFTQLDPKNDESRPEIQERPRSSPETKTSKKQRKNVKSWAESILSMRSKGKIVEGTPSSGSSSQGAFAPTHEFSLDDVNFDHDTSCVIKSPGYTPPVPTRSPVAIGFASEDNESEVPGSVLDLDAAWEELDENEKSGSFRAKKKRLHSRNSNPSFLSSSTQLHRRTESAPALTPMSTSATITRSTKDFEMSDVFEEDEEQAEQQHISESPVPETEVVPTPMQPEQEDETDGLGVTVIDEATSRKSTEAEQPAIPDSDAGESLAPSQYSEIRTPRDVPELSDVPVEIVDSVDEPRFSVITKSSDESTVTPTLPGSPPQELSAVSLPYGYNERHAASVPDVISFAIPSSQRSPHEPRISTMSSFHTDTSTLSSGKQHEVGTAMSYSTEDVPSLTSSASTTASVRAAQLSNLPLPRPSADRSQSFSGVPRRSRNMSAVKRASLASLSKLVSGSFGERSKLSLEVLPLDETERTAKKKRNRISKLVKFWKSKDKTAAES